MTEVARNSLPSVHCLSRSHGAPVVAGRVRADRRGGVLALLLNVLHLRAADHAGKGAIEQLRANLQQDAASGIAAHNQQGPIWAPACSVSNAHLRRARDGRGEGGQAANLLRLELAQLEHGRQVEEGNEELLLAVLLLDVLGELLLDEVLQAVAKKGSQFISAQFLSRSSSALQLTGGASHEMAGHMRSRF